MLADNLGFWPVRRMSSGGGSGLWFDKREIS